MSDLMIQVRNLQTADISLLVSSFEAVNWTKPTATFMAYLEEQQQGTRDVWVAYVQQQIAWYCTLQWESKYQPFCEAGIPEIMDLNVLPKFRRRGIGSQLLALAERKAATKSSQAGIGVGLDASYGAAQKLYIQTGYMPDGKGITYNYLALAFGSVATLDDDLILWLIKNLHADHSQ
jgi:GNAT superfamily N-acetyltransferase